MYCVTYLYPKALARCVGESFTHTKINIRQPVAASLVPGYRKGKYLNRFVPFSCRKRIVTKFVVICCLFKRCQPPWVAVPEPTFFFFGWNQNLLKETFFRL